jgi:hypothetical protein
MPNNSSNSKQLLIFARPLQLTRQSSMPGGMQNIGGRLYRLQGSEHAVRQRLRTAASIE